MKWAADSLAKPPRQSSPLFRSESSDPAGNGFETLRFEMWRIAERRIGKENAAFDASPATHQNATISLAPRALSEFPGVQNDLAASFVFGAGLILLGAWLVRWHLRTWQGHRSDETLNAGERAHYRAQVRRRIHISFLLILLGIIIPAWDLLTTRGHLSKQAALLGIIVMLLIALWIMVLAMFDWLSTRIRRRAMMGALASLARKRRELEDEVTRLRQQQRNGRG